MVSQSGWRFWPAFWGVFGVVSALLVAFIVREMQRREAEGAEAAEPEVYGGVESEPATDAEPMSEESSRSS